MKMKKFEEYLKEVEGNLNRITLFKLIPTDIKQFYKIEKSYEHVVDYQKVLDVLNGDDEGFYIFNNTSYSTKDMLDVISIEDRGCVISQNVTDNTVSLLVELEEPTESQWFIAKKSNVEITYDDNGNISEMSLNNTFRNDKYYYEYDEHNRLERFYNTNPQWNHREVDKPWIIEYDDVNNISFNQRTREYTKYDKNMNKLYSVTLSVVDKSILALKKYSYSNNGTINIIDIDVCCKEINKFSL